MKKSFAIYQILSIITFVIVACGGNQNSSKIDKDYLLKNKFLSNDATLTFENETNYKIVGSMSGCSWSNEGTYAIEGERILLHPTKCENGCDENSDPCESSVGEAICTFNEKEGSKIMHVQASNTKGMSDDYIIVDKFNPCKELKKEQANVGDGPTELEGKWISISDPNSSIEYTGSYYATFDASGQKDGEGEFKISNIDMISECFNDQNIKSLKSGKYLTTGSFMGTSCAEYKIEGDILTYFGSKFKRLK